MYFHCIVEMIDCRRYHRSSYVTHALYRHLTVRLDVTTPFAIPGFSRSFISQRTNEEFFVFIVRVPVYRATTVRGRLRGPSSKRKTNRHGRNKQRLPWRILFNSIVSGKSPVSQTVSRALQLRTPFIHHLSVRLTLNVFTGTARSANIVDLPKSSSTPAYGVTILLRCPCSADSSVPNDREKTEIVLTRTPLGFNRNTKPIGVGQTMCVVKTWNLARKHCGSPSKRPTSMRIAGTNWWYHYGNDFILKFNRFSMRTV